MKTVVIYWSGTGNTEAMANAVAEGAGAEVFSVSDFKGNIGEYDRVALGCPAMGAEVLEEDEFEPFYSEAEPNLAGKTVLLFGSYDWGDGEWMRSWTERAQAGGINVLGGEGFIVNNTPDDEALEKCRELGKELVK